MEKIHEGMLLEASIIYTYHEFCETGQFDQTLVITLVEHGIVEPQGSSQERWVFTSLDLVRTQKALRLYHDLEVNWAGISLILELLDEIEELRQKAKLNN